jgi:WD40 repeat protein
MSLLKLRVFCITAVLMATADGAAASENHLDLYGDPLPEGAVLRSDQIAFSANGKQLLAFFGPSAGGAYCWDIAGGRLLWQNKEFECGIDRGSLAITRDGKIISTIGQFRATQLATGRPVELEKWPIPAPNNLLYLAPDGRTLLVSTGKRVSGMGDDVVFAPDGQTVVSNNGALQRWDLATGKPLWSETFDRGHVSEVVALAFSADGMRLASASRDGSFALPPATCPSNVLLSLTGKS